MPQAKDMSRFVIALFVAAAITGLAAIPGTPWSGFVHVGLLFFGIFAGMMLLMHMLDNAAQDALGGPAPKKATAHKKR
jgi:crotonobetainyl-CoA:carnitine CoA-transferase CaiB-like acyl-CoA transferase